MGICYTFFLQILEKSLKGSQYGARRNSANTWVLQGVHLADKKGGIQGISKGKTSRASPRKF